MPGKARSSVTHLGHAISLSWGRSVCWPVRLPSSRPQEPAVSGRAVPQPQTREYDIGIERVQSPRARSFRRRAQRPCAVRSRGAASHAARSSRRRPPGGLLCKGPPASSLRPAPGQRSGPGANTDTHEEPSTERSSAATWSSVLGESEPGLERAPVAVAALQALGGPGHEPELAALRAVSSSTVAVSDACGGPVCLLRAAGDARRAVTAGSEVRPSFGYEVHAWPRSWAVTWMSVNPSLRELTSPS